MEGDLGGVAEGGGNLFRDPHDAMNEGISGLSFIIIRCPKEEIIFGEHHLSILTF